MNKREIMKKINQCEKDKIGYLECDNKAGARRKEKQIEILHEKLRLIELDGIDEQYKIALKFIKEKGMLQEFDGYMINELSRW